MSKYNIAVCDDEKSAREYLTELIKDWASARKISVQVKPYISAEDFLWEESLPDIAFLDIQMGGMDGMELARHIRKTCDTMELVFVTGYAEYAKDGYEVEASGYIMKPICEERLFAVLDKAIGRLSKKEQSLLIQTGETNTRILVSKIMYIEAFLHNVKVYTADGQAHETRKNISTLAEQLGEGFFRCHRSYIVSLKYISQVGKTDIIMDGDIKIPLSRRLYKEANKAFINFHGVDIWD